MIQLELKLRGRRNNGNITLYFPIPKKEAVKHGLKLDKHYSLSIVELRPEEVK